MTQMREKVITCDGALTEKHPHANESKIKLHLTPACVILASFTCHYKAYF